MAEGLALQAHHPAQSRKEESMKISAATHSSKPGAVNNKNPLGILIALAFFAGTPMWHGQQFLLHAVPEPTKHPGLDKHEEK
jgi:hypothetical protein